MENKIKLYSQQGCPQCKMFQMLMDKEGIAYEECQDIEVMRSKGISHTPALEVNGMILYGAEIRDYIKLGTLPVSDSCSSCEVK